MFLGGFRQLFTKNCLVFSFCQVSEEDLQICCWICCLQIMARFPYWHKTLVLEKFIKKWLILTLRSKFVEWFYYIFYNLVPEFKQQKIKSSYANRSWNKPSRKNLLLPTLWHCWHTLNCLELFFIHSWNPLLRTSTICLSSLKHCCHLYIRILLKFYGFQTS